MHQELVNHSGRTLFVDKISHGQRYNNLVPRLFHYLPSMQVFLQNCNILFEEKIEVLAYTEDHQLITSRNFDLDWQVCVSYQILKFILQQAYAYTVELNNSVRNGTPEQATPFYVEVFGPFSNLVPESSKQKFRVAMYVLILNKLN